ncbi:MAG: glycosyltransferase 87 family protein [Solirubrobacteraceae bacterium]
MSVAAASEPLPVGVRQARWAPALAALFGLLILAATTEVVIDGSVGHSALIPKQPAIAGWLSGLGERLGYRVFVIALLVAAVSYAGLLALASTSGPVAISKRWAIALLVALHLVVFVGPILLSTDVFSYIAYARMGVEHGLNPYLHGPAAIAQDPVFKYVGHDWRNVATAYGPLYTLFSYPLALLGVEGALWGMKLEALLASAGTLLLVWRCARIRKLEPVFAILAVGANPLYVIYGLGGAHNDLVMMLLMMAAVALMLRRPATRLREGAAGAIVVAGALVKATVAALLPFMILSRRRLAPILGALAALLVGAVVAYLAFGVHGLDIVAALNRDAAFVSTDSFANEIAHLLGKPGVFPVDHDLLKAVLVLIILHLLWRTWRGYDWVAASGWTLLAISVTSTWLLAWYILWPLPLAVVARDRRLLIATLFVQGLFVIHQITPLLAPVQ